MCMKNVGMCSRKKNKTKKCGENRRKKKNLRNKGKQRTPRKTVKAHEETKENQEK